MNRQRVAVIPGDGIGPEIMEASLSVLEAAGADLEFEFLDAGQSAIESSGGPLPAELLARMREIGTALKGPLISPASTGPVTIDRGGRAITHSSLGNAFRDALGLFVNVRPIRSWGGLEDARTWSELVVIRMVSEGSYSGLGHWLGDYAGVDIRVISRAACERFLRFTFDFARRTGHERLVLGHKSALLPHTDGLMVEIAREIADQYPDTSLDFKLVDALAADIVSRPEDLDVLVLEYQYGDILSDVAAARAGSIGTGAGANFGDEVAMFEASHGAAPDIAGRGIANPLGLILSANLMLRHLGRPDAADRIDSGVARVVTAGGGYVTPDLGGSATTERMARAVRDAIEWES